MIKNIEHVVVGGGKNLLCHWPRQGGIWNWGQELLAAYIESPCSYKNILPVLFLKYNGRE